MEILRRLQDSVDGPVIIQPSIFRDDRGYFFESFNEAEFNEKVSEAKFVQDNESKSSYGVVRGLHFQNPPYAQAKLVRVVSGAVFDVAVDIRKGSPTYGTWTGAYLSGQNQRQFFIPRGFAHGFISLADNTIFQYKCDNYYNKESEGCIKWNDPTIGITWAEWMNFGSTVTSEKDEKGVFFTDFESQFEY